MSVTPAGPATKRISCVVCAYNEEDRIRNILEAVHRHPALAEVIVVNDGSTDATLSLLANYPSIKVISYAPNRGKTYALSSRHRRGERRIPDAAGRRPRRRLRH